jgi:4-aminobutyrate aminotransferase
MANAAERGLELKEGLQRLSGRHQRLCRVRGVGLMVAADVMNSDGAYDPTTRDAILDRCFESGLLLLGCGESAIRFCPPLCITSGQVKTCLALLDRVVSAVFDGG